jgi:hypothetical protein
LDEVFLPQLLREAYIESEHDDKDEAVHFIQAKLDKIESLKKVERDIVIRLLTANIQKYLLHPADRCFRVDDGIFSVIITRKSVSREDGQQFIRNIKTAMDDLILIYPNVKSIVSTNMLSWAEIAENTLDEMLKTPFDVVEEDGTAIDATQKEARPTLIWMPSVLRQILNKKEQEVCSQDA